LRSTGFHSESRPKEEAELDIGGARPHVECDVIGRDFIRVHPILESPIISSSTPRSTSAPGGNPTLAISGIAMAPGSLKSCGYDHSSLWSGDTASEFFND
jgi:hypothetical protein